MNAVRFVARCALVLLTACGSDKDPTASDAPPAAAIAPAGSNAQTGSPSAGTGDVSSWVESDSASDSAIATTRARLADPDAVIERYKSECGSGAKSPECRALRLDVEAIFLQSLLTVRSGNSATVDPKWYRLAAASETAQLACIGVNELIWDPKRSAQDEALIMRALDSPYPAVRAAVFFSASKVPALGESWKRSGGFDYRSLSGVCVEDERDAVPGAKWAGNYPGAQFRAFASNASRRWFTTADDPEKVTAWFAARGKPAQTEQQMMEASQAKLMEEMTQLSQNPEEDNTAKIMQLMAGQGAPSQWGAPFRNMEGIGEIKYVMIGANQALAIFRDDVLKATSIVAPRPAEPLDLTPDLEAAREEAEMQAIFRY
jgi:hypothetical protein